MPAPVQPLAVGGGEGVAGLNKRPNGGMFPRKSCLQFLSVAGGRTLNEMNN
jgi:hypothetical protein